MIPALVGIVLISGCMSAMQRTMEPLIGIEIPALIFDTGNEAVDRMIVSSDQKYMATFHRLGEDGEAGLAGIRLWRIDGLRPSRVFSFDVTNHGLEAGRFDPDQMRFIARVDDSIVSWPLHSEESRKTRVLSDLITVSPDARYSLHQSPQSQETMNDRLLQIHRTDDNSTTSVIRESFYDAEAVYRFSDDGGYLLRYGLNVPLTLWNVADGTEMLNLNQPIDPGTTGVEISPDGGWLGITDGRMYDLTLRRWAGPANNDRNSDLIRFSPDSSLMAILKQPENGNSELHVFKRETNSGTESYQPIQTMRKDHITAIAFAPDSQSIFIGTDSGQITKRSIRDQRN